MAILLHTGVPGAGKSYYVVYQLLRSEVLSKYMVFHNLDGLRPELFPHGEHLRYLGDYFSWENIRDHLSKSYWETMVRRARDDWDLPVLLILDECQNFLGEFDPRILEFFSWHRHQGMDIWLICQHRTMIDRSFRNLAEYEITGNKGYVVDQFVYTFKQGRAVFKTVRLKKDPAVFAVYRSFQFTGAAQKTSKLVWWGLGAMVMAGILVAVVIWRIPGVFAGVKGGSGGSAGTPARIAAPVISPSEQLPQVRPKPARSAAALACDALGNYSVAMCSSRGLVLQGRDGRLVGLSDVAPSARFIGSGDSAGEYRVLLEGAICTVKRRYLGVVPPGEPRGSDPSGGPSAPLASN